MKTIDEAIAHAREVAKEKRNEHFTFGIEKCKQCADEHEQLSEWLEELKEYKDAEEKGLLLRLPCKVGTSYWTFDSQYWIEEEKCKGCEHYFDCDTETFCDADEDYPKCTQIVKKVFLNNLEIVSLMNQFGKTVFLTKEEAEQALEQMKEGAE